MTDPPRHIAGRLPHSEQIERLVMIAHEFQTLLLDHVHDCGTHGSLPQRYSKADAERLADEIQRLSNGLTPPVALH